MTFSTHLRTLAFISLMLAPLGLCVAQTKTNEARLTELHNQAYNLEQFRLVIQEEILKVESGEYVVLMSETQPPVPMVVPRKAFERDLAVRILIGELTAEQAQELVKKMVGWTKTFPEAGRRTLTLIDSERGSIREEIVRSLLRGLREREQAAAPAAAPAPPAGAPNKPAAGRESRAYHLKEIVREPQLIGGPKPKTVAADLREFVLEGAKPNHTAKCRLTVKVPGQLNLTEPFTIETKVQAEWSLKEVAFTWIGVSLNTLGQAASKTTGKEWNEPGAYTADASVNVEATLNHEMVLKWDADGKHYRAIPVIFGAWGCEYGERLLFVYEGPPPS